MSVVFEELADSPIVRFDDGRFEGLRRFKVGWNDRFDFLLELYGGYRIIGGQFTFTPPAVFPGVPGATVTNIELEPFPANLPDGTAVSQISRGSNAYPAALATATYRIRVLDGDQDRDDLPGVSEGTYLSYRADLSSEYESVPGRTWRWTTDQTPLGDDVDPRILVPTEAFTLTWHRVPRPPWDAMRDLRGRLNDGTFLNHSAKSVLFLGARTRRDFQIKDTGLWRIEYHFKVKVVSSTATTGVLDGWNRRYREQAAAGEHWLAIEDEDNNEPYAVGNFANLFSFGP